MKALYDIPAPAKLNLFLHITGQRDDGYHLLESVFVLIDWCDTLHFEVRTDGRITREDLTVALPEDDLIVRAARLLQQRAQHSARTPGAHIGIHKRIPSQAGMGGGSSDAASVLIALNRLWGLNLNRHELAALGLQLGADVPFFIHGCNAFVRGVGECVTPLEGSCTLPNASFVVVKPEVGIATKEIFSSPHLQRNQKPVTMEGFAADPFRFGCNVLQPVVEKQYPQVIQAIGLLQTQGLHARMTGSGSAVFAHLPEGFTQVQWENLCSMTKCAIQRCRMLDRHPLFEWCGNS